MLEIKGQEPGTLLEVTVEATATKEDLEKFKDALHAKALQEEPVNILFVFQNIKGITFKGWLEDMKTFPKLKSIGKGAIVGDDTFSTIDSTIANLIPGVEVKQFEPGQLEDARKWLKK